MLNLIINDFALAKNQLETADAILITASNGLSIAEGYHIFADNEPFRRYFQKFRSKYGVDCLIRGVFTPMSAEDHAEYMRTVRRYLIEDYKGGEPMKNLLTLVGAAPYFVVTSNGDRHFQLNGFDANRIFEIEGNFDGLEEGSAEWLEQRGRFSDFLKQWRDARVALLELGIGSRNRLIKAPTMQLAVENPTWRYITMNMPNEIFVPRELASRAIALTGDVGANFRRLLAENGRN